MAKKKRKSPKRRVRFQDNNDCKKSLRPTTLDRSRSKYCTDVGKEYKYYRTQNYYGCCKKKKKSPKKKNTSPKKKTSSFCKGATLKGKKCKNPVKSGKYCHLHK